MAAVECGGSPRTPRALQWAGAFVRTDINPPRTEHHTTIRAKWTQSRGDDGRIINHHSRDLGLLAGVIANCLTAKTKTLSIEVRTIRPISIFRFERLCIHVSSLSHCASAYSIPAHAVTKPLRGIHNNTIYPNGHPLPPVPIALICAASKITASLPRPSKPFGPT